MTQHPQHPTCKQRIAEHYRSRIATLTRLWQDEQGGGAGVEDVGTLSEFGLSFDYVAPGTFTDQTRGYFRYQLSWGGPSDEFRFFCDERRRPVRIEYWFLDWFDGAHLTLRAGSKAERLMGDLFQWFDVGGLVEAEYQRALAE